MGVPGLGTRSCPLCDDPFVVPGPPMIHPADSVCNDCVAELWASDESDDQLQGRLAPRIAPELGLDPRYVASAIITRLRALRREVTDEGELYRVLAQRDPGWRATPRRPPGRW